MLNLDQLEVERAQAQTDKADLFDFYHANWAKLFAELKRLRELVAFTGHAATAERIFGNADAALQEGLTTLDATEEMLRQQWPKTVEAYKPIEPLARETFGP